MIVGVGSDLVQKRRIVGVCIRQGERFGRKILGTQELLLYQVRKQHDEERGIDFLASRFAAKEAFSKALRIGFRAPMSWHSCQIIPNNLGAPEFIFSNELANYIAVRGWNAHISLSDESHHALAFVVIEKRLA